MTCSSSARRMRHAHEKPVRDPTHQGRATQNCLLDPGNTRHRIVTLYGRGSYCWRVRVSGTPASRNISTHHDRLSASGVGVFTMSASPGSTNFHEAGVQLAFPPSIVVAIKALACELPSRRGLPLARWSVSRIAPGSDGERHRRENQRHHSMALAQPGCVAPLEASHLDLPTRSAIRPQGRPRSRSLPAPVAWHRTGST